MANAGSFKKGERRKNQGGKRPGAGRPTATKLEIRRQAQEIAREYIEDSVKPVLHTYFQLAHGRLVNKWHEGEVVGQEFEADPATTRHFVDKIVPPVERVEHTGNMTHTIDRDRLLKIMRDPDAMRAAEILTSKLVKEQQNHTLIKSSEEAILVPLIPSNENGNGNGKP